MRRVILLFSSCLLFLACSSSEPTPSKDTASADQSTQDSVQMDSHSSDGGETDEGSQDVVNVDAVEDTTEDVTTTPPPPYLGGERPAMYYLPNNQDPSVPMPVVVLLHGYTGTAVGQNAYFGLSNITKANGILLITPDGTKNLEGLQFWNATNSCCNFYGSTVDDVAYIAGLIDEAKGVFNIDDQRVYLLGHSNGGYMSYRMACEHPELFAGIVSLAGSDWYDTKDCVAPAPLAVLQVHGEWDATIRYDGLEMNVGDPNAPPVDVPSCLADECTDVFTGCTGDDNCNSLWECFLTCPEAEDSDACIGTCWNASPKPTQDQWTEVYVCGVNAGCYDDLSYTWPGYPGAEEVVARWAERNGCSDTTSPGTALDLVADLAGIDTYPQEHNDCPDGLQATLWRIEKGSHVPSFGGNWSTAVIEWMLNQVKPVQ